MLWWMVCASVVRSPAALAISMACLELNHTEVARRTIEAFAGQLAQNAESMSAMVGATEAFVAKRGPIEVAAKPQVAGRRPLKPAEQAAQIVAMDAEWENPTTLRIALRIADGFHINANETEGDLIPTRLQVDRDASVVRLALCILEWFGSGGHLPE